MAKRKNEHTKIFVLDRFATEILYFSTSGPAIRQIATKASLRMTWLKPLNGKYDIMIRIIYRIYISVPIPDFQSMEDIP